MASIFRHRHDGRYLLVYYPRGKFKGGVGVGRADRLRDCRRGVPAWPDGLYAIHDARADWAAVEKYRLSCNGARTLLEH